MKRWTAAQIEELLNGPCNADGQVRLPVGNYSAVSVYQAQLVVEDGSVFAAGTVFNAPCAFGSSCRFGSRCSFSYASKFGNSCQFGPRCSFDTSTFKDYCKFGSSCKFVPRCKFGKQNVFGAACIFEEGAEFEQYCRFGAKCVIDTCSRIGPQCSFAEGCRIGNGSYVERRSVFRKGCVFGKEIGFGAGILFHGQVRVEQVYPTRPGYPLLSFGGAGSHHRTVYAFNTVHGIYIRAGCFYGNLDKFRKQVLADCCGNEQALKAIQYLGFARLVEESFERQNRLTRELKKEMQS
jgi:NDP-sugar pyrophosphorylase family protein